MTKAGWVFRVEVVTTNPAKKTEDMIRDIINKLTELPDVSDLLVNELYEEIKLFKKEAKAK